MRYFAPTEGPRTYWSTDTYCCPCNYRRIVAELPQMVYYRSGDGLVVNLYAASQAKLTVGQGVALTVMQETDYPTAGSIRLRVQPERAARFALHLRIPAWAKGASVKVNGTPTGKSVQSGAFLKLSRVWKPGDQVALDLPMSWRLVKGRQRQAGRVAVMRGPQVFCLNPAQNEALSKLDATDLGYLALDPESMSEAIRSEVVRPGGVGCRVSAWKAGFGVGKKGDYELVLTEFPDPDGKATYFRLRDLSAAVEDELMGRRK